MRGCLAEGTLRGYFDGELSDKEVASVAAHLSSCEACTLTAQEMEEGIETLRQAFSPLISLPVPSPTRLQARLNMAISTLPPKSGIEARRGFDVPALLTRLFNVSNTMPRFLNGFAALLVALMLVIAAVVLYESRSLVQEQAKIEPLIATPSGSVLNAAQALSYAMSGPAVEMTVNKAGSRMARSAEHTGTRGKSRNERREFSPSLAGGAGLIPGEQKQLDHIAMLTASLEGGARPMQPILRVEYERNLAVVDVAIKAIRRVALNNPRDKNAAGFLLAAYQSKISLLRAVASHAEPQNPLVED
jgi:hypothetical protein